tara:strand:- start:6 stop:155 length:150 start_codon:yes stop_codon:yes gene_type:complete
MPNVRKKNKVQRAFWVIKEDDEKLKKEASKSGLNVSDYIKLKLGIAACD